MSERGRMLERIVARMQTVSDDLRLPQSIWTDLADAALREIEAPASSHDQVIKPCTCGNTGYGDHMLGCALYE